MNSAYTKILTPSLILHEIEDVFYELALISHRRGELSANPLNSATKQPAIIELIFLEAMVPKLMSFDFERLCILFNLAS